MTTKLNQNKELANTAQMIYYMATKRNPKEIAENNALTMVENKQMILRLNEAYKIPLLNLQLDNMFAIADKKGTTRSNSNLKTRGSRYSLKEIQEEDEERGAKKSEKDPERVLVIQDLDYGLKGKSLLVAHKITTQSEVLNSITAMHPMIIRALPKPPALASHVMTLVSSFCIS